MTEMTQDALQTQIDVSRKDIRTKSYSMSIGEWMHLYQNGEIIIQPVFQRYFRWSVMQKSRLIESILLGIPIPPIFVFQRNEDDLWEVIDGLQRLATIFEFTNLLSLPDDTEERLMPLRLLATTMLPALEGKAWDADDLLGESFTVQQRVLFKRAKLDVIIIERESTEEAKYELFDRLNTGGSQLTDQEVRNALLSLISPPFLDFLAECAQYEHFADTIRLTDRQTIEQYDKDLVLRFVVLRHAKMADLHRVKDISDFLMSGMRDIAHDAAFDFEAERRAFTSVFDLLADTVGADAFRKYSPDAQRFTGGFSISAYEAIAVGLGRRAEPHLPALTTEGLTRKIEGLWTDPVFQARTGSGKRFSERIPHLVQLGERLFGNED